MKKKVVIAFVPVLHEGYLSFFNKHKEAEVLYIFGKELIEKDFPHLQKEIRAIEPNLIKKILLNISLFKDIKILDLEQIEELVKEEIEIIFPDEDVSRELSEKYFKNKTNIFDKVFLRLDKHKSMEERPVEADQQISKREFDKEILQKLKNESLKSSDWWRQIGAAIIKDEKILSVSHNRHLPSEHSPYTNGDPRNNFHKGIGIELSTAIHAEASLIAEAARKGISVEGASMYVTIFPCPVCAKLITESGIKKVYYGGGYTLLDQDKLLKSAGVEIIYIDMN